VAEKSYKMKEERGKETEAILAVLEKFCNSLQRRDLDALQSLMHEEIVFIPHDTDLLFGCKEVCQYYYEMLQKLTSLLMNFKDVKIKISFPYAWVAGRWEAEGKIRRQVYNLKGHFRAQEENHARTEGRFSAIFQKEEKGWVMLHGHSSVSI